MDPDSSNLTGREILSRLPGELKSMVIACKIVPQRPCLNGLLDSCFDPWSCENGSHGTNYTVANVPCPLVTSINSFYFDEANKQFFQNHTFVFESSGWTEVFDHHRLFDVVEEDEFRVLESWASHLRNSQATRLLDFVDHLEWRGKGSDKFNSTHCSTTYQYFDQYHFSIRHLVFAGKTPWGFEPDWAWALNVDWQTLPHLKTLVLDLRSYSFREYLVREIASPIYEQIIESGAKRMECLNLKSQIIYGLCSEPVDEEFEDDKSKKKEAHKRRMKSLFIKAVDVGGHLEFRDKEMIEPW